MEPDGDGDGFAGGGFVGRQRWGIGEAVEHGSKALRFLEEGFGVHDRQRNPVAGEVKCSNEHYSTSYSHCDAATANGYDKHTTKPISARVGPLELAQSAKGLPAAA